MMRAGGLGLLAVLLLLLADPSANRGGAAEELQAAAAVPPARQRSDGGGREPAEPFHSSLFGAAGELFEPGARMFDPSWAGYGGGRRPPSSGGAQPVINVLDYGAVPDDNASDSEALAAALGAAAVAAEEDTDDGQFAVILFPQGTYHLRENVTVTRPVVLRGEGRDLTRIVFLESMDGLHPGAWRPGEGQASPWSFRHMIIEFRGEDRLYAEESKLADVTEETVPGSRRIAVSNTEGIEPGMRVRLVARDPGDGSLLRYLYGETESLGPLPGLDISDLVAKAAAGRIEGDDCVDPVRFVSRVERVLPAAGQVLLERAVPYALRASWSPAVMRFEPEDRLSHVGIEGMTLEHPWTPYPGHFKELGHNSVGFVGVSDCWARGLRILNADTAVALEFSHYCSIDDVEIGVTAPRAPLPLQQTACHHGFSVGHSADIAITGFKVLTRCEHDVSIDHYTASSVVAGGGWGIDLNLDFHRSAPHGNLVSNVSCGLCTRPFFSGGAPGRGLNAGARNTFWNLHATGAGELAARLDAWLGRRRSWLAAASRAIALAGGAAGGFSPPPPYFGAALNFVGCGFPSGSDGEGGSSGSGGSWLRRAGRGLGLLREQGGGAPDLRPTWLVEPVPAGRRLEPDDLHAAMRDARLQAASAGA